MNKPKWILLQKIDPFFEKVIRIYVDFLSQLEINPREGRLTFPEDCLEPIIQKSDWQSLTDDSIKDFLTFIRKAGGLEGKDVRVFLSLIEALEKEDINTILKICSRLIKTLPEEESRLFYLESLRPFRKDPALKDKINSSEQVGLDFFSIVFSLLARYMFVQLFEKEREVVDENIEYFKRSNTAIAFINILLSIFSQIANLKALTDLQENIAKGDDKAIFKAITIDKSILYVDEVKTRIQTAQLTGDSKFFSNLGRAIAANPLKRIGQHGKTYAVLKMFWFTGLYKLTNEELYDFLKSCGLIPPAYPYAFEKFIQRHMKFKLAGS